MNNLTGITSTVPVEIIFAAGLRPVDLNNLFISEDQPSESVSLAEKAGFSRTVCAWIKGIYSTVIRHGIRNVITVTGGDCSNAVALGELLTHRGVNVIPFEYPLNRDREALKEQMEKLGETLSTTWPRIEAVKLRLDRIRGKLRILDENTFHKNLVSGSENHQFLVGSSDFSGDPDDFEEKLDLVLEAVKDRKPRKEEIRLGYLGVPPIFNHFYERLESFGARVVFNEVQRQFSMPLHHKNIVDQYLEYTYPYGIIGRLKDIDRAITERQLDGLIHYTQTFCYRQIYDIILRESLPLPILTIEGDRPEELDSRTSLRIETFVEMLHDKKVISQKVQA